MRILTISVFSFGLAFLVSGCAMMPNPPPVWGHTNHAEKEQPPATWKLYKDENLLTGWHVLTLCGTSEAEETKGTRFCFRRERDQLVIYIIPFHERVATARMGAGLLTLVRVDENRPISPRSARGQPWGRGFNPRFPDASFPVDGTHPRTGIVEPNGLFYQLREGETLSALVPLRPNRFGEYTIHLDGFAPLLKELWEHEE